MKMSSITTYILTITFIASWFVKAIATNDSFLVNAKNIHSTGELEQIKPSKSNNFVKLTDKNHSIDSDAANISTPSSISSHKSETNKNENKLASTMLIILYMAGASFVIIMLIIMIKYMCCKDNRHAANLNDSGEYMTV